MNAMDSKTAGKLGAGSILAVVGGMGIFLALVLDTSSLEAPWGFVLAFVFGVVMGIGATLSVSGLLERRRSQ